MVERIGAMIGILAFALSSTTLVAKLMSLLLLAMNWPHNLHLLPVVVLVITMVLLIVHAVRRPGVIEKLYKNPGEGAIIGFVLCFTIAIEFTVFEEYQFGDAMSTALVLLSGILFVISGLVMIHEVKEGTEQVHPET